MICGDAYRVHLPRFFGRRRLICDPATHGQPFDLMRSTTFNVLECIEMMQPAFSQTLSDEEQKYLLSSVARAVTLFELIEKLYKIGFGPQAKTDLAASVDAVFQSPPDFGASRWHSLQAAEKYLKTYLNAKETAFPKGASGHDLV